jgi:hypothetical protein
MFASETAGTPLGKRALKEYVSVPGDMSVTMPSTSTLLPCTETFGPAVKVVALGPLPIAYTRLSYVSSVAIMLSAMIGCPPARVYTHLGADRELL